MPAVQSRQWSSNSLTTGMACLKEVQKDGVKDMAHYEAELKAPTHVANMHEQDDIDGPLHVWPILGVDSVGLEILYDNNMPYCSFQNPQALEAEYAKRKAAQGQGMVKWPTNTRYPASNGR